MWKKIFFGLILVLCYLGYQFFTLTRTPDNWRSNPGIQSFLNIRGGMYIAQGKHTDMVEDLLLDGYTYIPKSLTINGLTMEKKEKRFPFTKYSKLTLEKMYYPADDSMARTTVDLRNDIWFLNMKL